MIEFRVVHDLVYWRWETKSITIDSNGALTIRLRMNAVDAGVYWFSVTLRVNEIPLKTFIWRDAFTVMTLEAAAAWAVSILTAIGLVVYNIDKIKKFLKKISDRFYLLPLFR